jgi:hypothetical protein
MNVKVLFESVKTDGSQGGLYNLFEPYWVARTDFPFNEYVVKKGEDMRIDLIFKSMYDMEAFEVEYYLEQVDIILCINNIDNPLNIMEGDILKYPALDALDNFRINEDPFVTNNNNLTQKLSKPNTSRKVDPQRKKFLQNNYSIPPTVAKTPKDPVVVKDGKFYVGGV